MLAHGLACDVDWPGSGQLTPVPSVQVQKALEPAITAGENGMKLVTALLAARVVSVGSARAYSAPARMADTSAPIWPASVA